MARERNIVYKEKGTQKPIAKQLDELQVIELGLKSQYNTRRLPQRSPIVNMNQIQLVVTSLTTSSRKAQLVIYVLI